MLKAILIEMRPKQWIKNIAIFAALVFSKSFFVPSAIAISFLTFFYFCLISGMGYLLNDIYDCESDKKHPKKNKRPIASGELKIKSAGKIVLIFTPVLILSCALWSWKLSIVLLIYFLLQFLYSVFLKNIVLLDVFAISFSFILRVLAGGIAIGVTISSWLFFCTLLLSLFLGLSKRRHELMFLKLGGETHRRTLKEYNVTLLDQLISLTTSILVACYILYSIANETVTRFGSNHLKYTTIFVLYGIFRYLYLIYTKNQGGDPDEILLRDKPFLINIILYILSCFAIIYMGV